MQTWRNGKGLSTRQALLSNFAIICYLAAFKLVLHLLTNGQYGYFRDELYYLACSDHLDWGYVDQPPLIALVTKATLLTLGHSLHALRFLPAVAGALLVIVVGLIVCQLEGGLFAVVLAAITIIIAPIYLIFHSILTMNAFEPLLWTLCAYVAILIFKGGNPKLWLLFGLIAGIGLMNKHSMLFWGVAFVVGLLLTPARRILLDKWLWLGGLVALLIFLPNLIWEFKQGWPTMEIFQNAARNQNLPISPLEFIKGQILLLHPLTFPIWIAGLWFYVLSNKGKHLRSLGWSFVAVLALLIVLKGKVYYSSPIYPMILAAGAVAIEQLFRSLRWAWLKPATLLLLITTGMITAPLAVPVLPVQTLVRYEGFLGVKGVQTEKNKWAQLPQHFADMFGWEELAATVARVYHSLPPQDKARCAIFGDNYGEAGAIDFFGEKYGLPKAISGHQNYYLWGPRDYTGECLITVGSDLEDLQPLFERVEPAATFTNEYVMPYENNLTIYTCWHMKTPLKEYWSKIKCYSC